MKELHTKSDNLQYENNTAGCNAIVWLGMIVALVCFVALFNPVDTGAVELKIVSNAKKNFVELEPGESADLQLKVSPQKYRKLYFKKFECKSSDPSKVTVDKYGVVQGVSNGSATISIKSVLKNSRKLRAKTSSIKSKKLKVKVKVSTKVQSISLDRDYFSAFVDDEVQLMPSVFPVDATCKKLEFTSADKSIATVDDEGVITPLKGGVTTVTVRSLDGGSVSKTITVEVDDIVTKEDVEALKADDSDFVAHRGLTAAAPENSMLAFRDSVNAGFKRFETDVRVTKDGFFLLSHDSNTLSACGIDMEIGESWLKDLGVLQLLDRNNNDRVTDQKFPLVEEMLSFCSTNDIRPQIELKDVLTKKQAEYFLQLLDRYDMRHKCQLSSFSMENLEMMYALDNSLDLLKINSSMPSAKIIDRIDAVNADITLKEVLLRRKNISLFKERDIDVFGWVVDDPVSIIKYMRRGVSGFTCDKAPFN